MTAPAPPRRGPRAPAWRRFARRPLGVAGALWLGVVITGAVFAPVLDPYDPQAQDLSSVLSGPTARHLLGTDQLGRDVLSQLLSGAGPALAGVAAAVAAWLAAGVTLGVIAGYARGTADAVIGRFADLLLSLPVLVILLVIFAVFPGALLAPMAILGLIASAGLVRVVRAVTLQVSGELYVRAARVAGLSHPKIVLRHVLPQIAPAVIVQAGLFAGAALITESGLAFLGFGIVPPAPSWGGLIAEASQAMSRSAWLLLPSGGVLGLAVAAFVLVGNAIADTVTEPWSPPRLAPRRPARVPAAPAVPASVPPEAVGNRGDALLEVEHLSVELPGRQDRRPVPVVTDISFVIGRGETVALLGESGCGKTITALAVLGLLPARGRASGRVLLDGQDLTAAPARVMAGIRGRRIGYIAQDPMTSLDPVFTVGSQVAEAVRGHTGCRRAEARRRAVGLLGSVNIPEPGEVARRYPHQLSGGMLQRCVTALALTGDPDLLIADEPTTALDVTIQAEILALMRRLALERGMSLLLVTHDWAVAASVADRALVMYAGQLAEEAPGCRLVRRPGSPLHPGAAGFGPAAGRPRAAAAANPGPGPRPRRVARRLPVRLPLPRGRRGVPS